MTTPSSSSFTLFPDLPPELRLQIYRHACHPRVTTLSFRPARQEAAFHCPTRPPTLLHISRESRAEGLRLYAKCPLPDPDLDSDDDEEQHYDDGAEKEEQGATEPRYFYHHPHHDTLYLPRPGPADDPFGLGYGDWARRLLHGPGATRTASTPSLFSSSPVGRVVRRLALDYVPGEVRRPWEVFEKVWLIRACPRLAEAYLVVAGGGGSGGSTSAAAAAAGAEGAQGREVEFVDPAAGDAEIVRIMERVRESFRVELGDGFGALGKDGGREGRVQVEVGLELIPKSKVLSAWGGRHVACAS